MHILLEFTGDGAELRLFHARVSTGQSLAGGSQTEIWDGMSAVPSQEQHIFQWRPAVCGFCMLILQAFIKGKPYEAMRSEGRRTPTASLVELLGDKALKGEPGMKTWAQHLFSSFIKPAGSDPRVPRNILVAKSYSGHKQFSVRLGAECAKAVIVIKYNDKEVDKAVAESLLLALESQHRPEQSSASNPRLTGGIDLLAWDSVRGQALSGDDLQFPLPVNLGVGVRLHFSRPAYPYVLWINSRQEVQPLHPWNNFEWSSVVTPALVTELALPAVQQQDGLGYYPIESRPGVETALVLANDAPASARSFQLLRKSVSNCRVILPDPGKIYRMTDLRPQFDDRPKLRLGAPRSVRDPLSLLRDTILSVVGRDFACIAGISFCTKRAG